MSLTRAVVCQPVAPPRQRIVGKGLSVVAAGGASTGAIGTVEAGHRELEAQRLHRRT